MTTKTSSSPSSPLQGLRLTERYLQLIRDVLDHELSQCRCRVYLFGSRAENRANRASDVDLAVDTNEGVKEKLARIQTAFEESEIPFTVDIVDLNSTSPALKQKIKQRGKLIWQS